MNPPSPIDVLIAEDEAIDLELTLRGLRQVPLRGGMQVVHDGQEAVDFLLAQGRHAGRRDAPPPRLVLLDVKLPKLDGLEVLARLRAHPATRLVPVVMLSSSQERVDVQRSHRLGANSYVVKPVQFEDYLQALRRVGRYWLELNQPAEDGSPGMPS
ncbi:response regulator [Aquincola tertiaricarbonis]|uniref:response regulator n=1 Tax=Aquincola tertiaricarbonis TaxID=391953 RepID=UPI0006153AD0|nr:response regulator [Aquincola tertiaricarbonis]